MRFDKFSPNSYSKAVRKERLYLSFVNILFFYIGWLSLVHFVVHFPSQERVVRELATDDLS